MPQISIITPCYNSAAFVDSAIKSVIDQTYSDWNLVVVDDGSTDDSASVIESRLENEPRGCLIRQSNGGVANARNNGYQAAAGESRYLLFLDADDRLEPTMIEKLIRHLESHPEAAMAFCDFFRVDENDTPLPEIKNGHGPGTRYVPWGLGARQLPREVAKTPFVSIFALAVIIPSITLIRRSMFERAGKWDESFGQIFEDTDLFLRIALYGEAHFIPEPLVRHRRHANNSTANAYRVEEQMANLYSKWLTDSRLSKAQRKLVRKSWRFIQGRLAPLSGFRGGTRELANGNVTGATRFWIGAIRRYFFSFCGWCPPAPIVPKQPLEDSSWMPGC